jgi:hypothetical protein
MRAGAVAAVVVGIVLVIIGIGIAVAYSASATGLGAGIALLAVGVIVAAVSAALGASRRSSVTTHRAASPVPPAGTTGDELMVAMVRSLAQMPEPQRREMMRTRLGSFDQMSEGDRTRAMQAMMQATRALDPEAMKRLTITRLESLAEDFDPAGRARLMTTHMKILMGMPPQVMLADLNLTLSVMGQCHEGCRMKDMATMKEIMGQMPPDRRQMLMQSLPSEMRSMIMG